MKKFSKLLASMSLLMLVSNTYAQYCRLNTTKITPDSRFEDLKDGTVKDKQTKLIWQRCSVGTTWLNGQCSGDITELTWYEALTKAKKIWQWLAIT